MSFEKFAAHILTLDASAHITHDADKGLHRARCTDNITITANTITDTLTVKWGHGHTAIIHI